MLRRLWIICLCLLCAAPGFAWEKLGVAKTRGGEIGESVDWSGSREQTGVLLRPPPGQGPLNLLELRIARDVNAPLDEGTGNKMQGVVGLGVHGHLLGAADRLHYGVDLVGVEPEAGMRASVARLIDDGDGNGTSVAAPTLRLTAARSLQLAPGTQALTFAQLQPGGEAMVRLGGDLVLGRGGRDVIPIRDTMTGQLIPAPHLTTRGSAVTVGFDMTHELGASTAPGETSTSQPGLRARAGGLMRMRHGQLFTGLTWLGDRGETGRDGRVLGALQMVWDF